MKFIYFFGFLSIIPVFGYLISSFFVDTFGRKEVISLCSLVSGLSLITFTFLHDQFKNIIVFYI